MAVENGITVTEFKWADSYGKSADFYSAFNPTSTSYIYNEAGGQAIADGEIDLRHIHSSGIVQISVPTLGSVSLDVRVEARIAGSSTWGLIYSKNYTAATTIDKIVNISEMIDYLRVGVKTTTDGTDVINIAGNFRTKTN